jgi:hypothetical protein
VGVLRNIPEDLLFVCLHVGPQHPSLQAVVCATQDEAYAALRTRGKMLAAPLSHTPSP